MYQIIILALIRTKPERRKVNFIFHPEGGSGKSVTADYITLNPEFNALLAPQLASSEAAFIDQLEQYLEVNKRYPTTIVLDDLTRNENNSNVESLYLTLLQVDSQFLDEESF